MLASSQWRSFPIHLFLVSVFIGLASIIDVVTSVNSDILVDGNKFSPQPASPPKPIFADVVSDELPPNPSPATPPKASPDIELGFDDVPSFDEAYLGKEYRFKSFVIRPAQLKLEGFLFCVLIIYVITSYSGKRKNERAVAHWLDANSQWLHAEFTHVGHGLPKDYIADGPALFYGYATGRKGCQSLTISFALRPRQDIPFMIYEEARAAIDLSWTGRSDRLELVWSLSPNNQHKFFQPRDSFVWALVEKRVMNLVREDRWDVRTFTEVKESNQLPSPLVFMSESAEITEQILKSKELGFVQLLQNSTLWLQWFDSLVISGTPREEPLISELPLPTIPSARTLTLRLRLPPPSRALDTLPLIKFSFQLIDKLDGAISLTSLATAKLTKRRTEISNLLSQEERKIQERSKEEERRKRQKAAQDEKLAKMSPAEQKKHNERERRRNASKIGKTTVKRK